MPQVFGVDEVELINKTSLWVEAASEKDIEQATHPAVAAEARARGLVPLRMGRDPIWHHPDSGKIITLTPAHSGDSANYTSMANIVAKLRRQFPTAEETAKAARTPEQIEADQASAAQETRSRKQQAVDAAKRKREQQAASEFRKAHGPFRDMGEVQRAFNLRSPKARQSRPRDTVEDFAERLRDLTPEARQQVHRTVFPEKYK